MPKLKKIVNYIKCGSLGFELEAKFRCAFVKDEKARTLIRERLIYNKFSKEYDTLALDDIYSIDQKVDNVEESIWIYWGRGIDNAPALVKACLNSVKRNLKDKKIIVLSDDNIDQYIDLPEFIYKKHKEGIISNAHFADLIRIELLCRYGGIWLDSTVLCTNSDIPDYYFTSPLFVYQSMDLDRYYFQYTRASNWLISARKGDRILLFTRRMLLEYWKNYDYLVDYFIFHVLFGIATRKYEKEWDGMRLMNNCTPHTMMFELSHTYEKDRWDELTSMSPFHKLERHTDYSKYKNSIYEHILDEYGDK